MVLYGLEEEDEYDHEFEECSECGHEFEECDCHEGDGTLWKCPGTIECKVNDPDVYRYCRHKELHEFIVAECFATKCVCPLCIQHHDFLKEEDFKI